MARPTTFVHPSPALLLKRRVLSLAVLACAATCAHCQDQETSLRETYDSALRSRNESGADALVIRILLKTGYTVDQAASALRKLDAANRGPLTRLLGIHGAYMPAEQRVQFLRQVAGEAMHAAPPADQPAP